jgi:anti-anti-sigma regulatory factor
MMGDIGDTDVSRPARVPSGSRLERSDLSCVRVCGELDVASAPELDAALQDRRITVVDLAGVTFVDVAGVRPVLRAAASAERVLTVLRPSACVRRLLDLLNVSLDDGRAVVARDGWSAAHPAGGLRLDGVPTVGGRSTGRPGGGTAPGTDGGGRPHRDPSPVPSPSAGAGWSSSTSDPDRPLDQLVDEVLDRIAPLQAVLGIEGATIEPAAVRRAGAAVLDAVRADRAGVAAAQLEDALWSTSRGGRAPAGWFATPLGALIARSGRGAPAPASRPEQGAPSDRAGAPRHTDSGPPT